ncbi:MAG: sodium/solute symporter [Opitutales bacterium]
MQLTIIDTIVFVLFVLTVVGIGLIKSKGIKNSSEDYFLAGRGLSWSLIGLSLIAANISTEQFVGASGSAAGDIGLAIASYEWMAAVTLVFVAFVSLPKFLKSGIYTMPQFLEFRFNALARTIMSILIIIIYVTVTVTAVIYSGAITASATFGDISIFGVALGITEFSWLIGIIAALYVCFGGLKACAWADLIQAAALIIGGLLICYFAFDALGAISINELGTTLPALPDTLTNDSGTMERFFTLNEDRLSMFLDKDHPTLPWTALLVGLWIPNFYYWGFNQFITQRTLGASSLQEGQKGVIFAAYMKLIMPFIIVVPGIIAFNIFEKELMQEATKDTSIAGSNIEHIAIYKLATNQSIDGLIISVNNEENAISDKTKASVTAEYNEIIASNKKPVFKMDNAWKKLNPTYAQEMQIYNESVLKENVATKRLDLVGYKYDSALGLIIKNLIPDNGFKGFILAALFGAVVSSLASMLNAASTIFTIDIYKRILNKSASDKKQVFIGRICVIIFAIFGCAIAPSLANPNFKGVFNFIQEFQGYLSPGILAVFIVGFFSKKAPRFSASIALIASPIIYGFLQYYFNDIAFPNRMAITFASILIMLYAIAFIKPEKEDVIIKEDKRFEGKTSVPVKFAGVGVLIITAALYVIFA